MFFFENIAIKKKKKTKETPPHKPEFVLCLDTEYEAGAKNPRLPAG